MLSQNQLEQFISYTPYNIQWRYESFDKKKIDKYFINDVKFAINGKVLTRDEKIELVGNANNGNYYINDNMKEKFKTYRRGRIMITNNCYEAKYRIGLGRLTYTKTFFNSDLGTKVKPILRPLSDLNKLIKFDSLKFDNLDVEVIPRLYFKDTYYCDVFEYEGKLHIERKTFEIHLIYQQLMKWHFDVYSLIDQGLAVDINNI